MDNGGDENSITYVILKRDSTKQLFIGYSGTRDTQQLITEILEAFPVFYDIHPEATDALVFDYFYKHYLNGFRDDILKFLPGILDAYPKYNVIFTGHSLGGAMTVHSATDFVLNGCGQNRTVSIYTFGQPRVGNPGFTDAISPKINGWFRVAHNKDLVAHIPPCLPGIEVPCEHDGLLPFYPYHAPEEIFYDEQFENYKECSVTDGEDKNCSDSLISDSIPDHLVYFGIEIGGLSG
eukprot:CAMPEP_0168342726 /NCGR_PEP_ID=MMETSP0213-20121227/15581_1 /TAXON_ID=151035 /ORGANISM="Euplotes harpa, Strain FSP1.4" /LENGTH=235 /DNA_ID=CAMNT_0008349709 /DNA_START=206 /DNA_END=913 /DNA_ORIENTATION=+